MINKSFGWTFNTVADEYDKWREEYVPELFKDIFTFNKIGKLSNVLEIGIGTGQATKPFLETGCTLTAVERGVELSKMCLNKYKNYPRFSVITLPFERYEQSKETYDLIFSASAFHWIPEEIGYSKVFDMLKHGGSFARFANHPFYNKKGQEELWADIEKVYEKYMPPKPSNTKEVLEYTGKMAEYRSNIARKYGFTDISYKLYKRSITYTSDEYIKRICIQNDVIALDEKSRLLLCNGIKSVIDSYGGIIHMYDTIDLNLARKQ